MGFFDFNPETGHILVEEDGRVALDTRIGMLNLVPDAAITLDDFEVTFPDLFKGVYYKQSRSGSSTHSCLSAAAIIEQEWGPTASSPYTLADRVLGTVPAGTDYLQIRVRIRRTVAPARMLGLVLGTNFPEQEWVKLDGTSVILEDFMGVARQIEFVLSGTSVLLRRRQSVNADGGVVSPRYDRFLPGETINNQVFYFPGPNAPEAENKFAIWGDIIQTRGPTTGGATHRPSGYEAGSANNSPCSRSLSGISYASTWAGTVIITPGIF